MRKVPSILTGGLYAVPALLGAVVAVVGPCWGFAPGIAAFAGGVLCAAVRTGGALRGWKAPRATLATPEDLD